MFLKYTCQHCCLCDKPIMLYLLWLFLQLHGTRQRRIQLRVMKAVRSLNAPASPFFVILYQNNEYRHILLYWTMLAHSKYTLSLCCLPSETRLARWNSLCIIVPSFSLPCCRMEAVTSPHSRNFDSCGKELKSHTFMT